MPNVKGLLADPEFNKLDPMQQRHVLGQVDPQFAQLSDEEYQTFRQKVGPAQSSQGPRWDTGSFLKTITTDSPLNPVNWPGMVKSAFESPFSDQNMQMAQHMMDQQSIRPALPEPFATGDMGAGAGNAVNMGLMGGIGKGLGMLPGGRIAAGVGAAAPDVGMGMMKAGTGAALASVPFADHMAGALMGGRPLWEGAKQIGSGLSKGYSKFKEIPPPPMGGSPPPSPGPNARFVPGQYDAPKPSAPPVSTEAMSDFDQGFAKRNAARAAAPATKIAAPPPIPEAAAPVAAPPAPMASSAEQSLPGGKAVIADDQIPVKAHETNVKVDQQIKDKVNNLAEYLRSKGGTAEHLDMIAEDPALTRQYLNEAHSYGKNKGNTVPKTGYKGLDKGSDSFKQVRQRILDMIDEEKNKQ